MQKKETLGVHLNEGLQIGGQGCLEESYFIWPKYIMAMKGVEDLSKFTLIFIKYNFVFIINNDNESFF